MNSLNLTVLRVPTLSFPFFIIRHLTASRDLIGYKYQLYQVQKYQLYDTTNENDKANINNEIIVKIENEQNPCPNFPENVGGHFNAYIAHISSERDEFIQISFEKTYVMALMHFIGGVFMYIAGYFKVIPSHIDQSFTFCDDLFIWLASMSFHN